MGGIRIYPMAIVLLVLAMAWVGFGCGGQEATTTSTSVNVVPTVSPCGSGGETDELLNKPLVTTELTPKEYVDAVEQGRPVVLLFYVPGSADDNRVLQNLTTLQTAFNDYVFLLYDYSKPDFYGDLSTLLKVNYPPEVVLVDAMGNVKEIWNGFVDEGTLNQSLVNLVKG